MSRITSGISGIGTIVSFGLGILSAILCVIGLFGMLIYAGGIGRSEKYTEMKHQEYLIKNPGHELWAGKHQLSQYKNRKFDVPIVVTLLNKADGTKYVTFVDSSDKKELIGDKLLVYVDDS